MKAANFLNILLAIALVLLCAKLHFLQSPAQTPVPPDTDESKLAVAESTSFTVDSTGLAPGVTGFGGQVPVTVEVKDGVVAKVSPKLPNDETPGFFQRLWEAGLWRAWDGMKVEEAVTARVDAVTSATYSSKAAIANVQAALAEARRRLGGERAEATTTDSDGEGAVATTGRCHDGPTAGAPSPPQADGVGASGFALAALGADASALSIVPDAAREFREFDVHADFKDNPFTIFTGRGMLLCAGDRESSNAMTIGWGGLGTLWGRNDAVTVYVAESRHTKSFMDRATHFTVMGFDKGKQSGILEYMGRNSGRDGDKAKALGLHLAYTANGTPYYEEAEMVLECELMYSAPFDPKGMKGVPSKLYANFPAGVHTMYIGRIVRAMRK